jgi:hypothetical protein
MELEVAIACVLTLLLWFLFRKTVGSWCDEYIRFEKKEEKDGEGEDPFAEEPQEKDRQEKN